jgi:hypothetical protein
MTKTSVYIVRAENSGCPESYMCGVYPTEELAEKRIAILEDEDGEYCFEYAWYDEVKVGENGADCFECNR